MQNYYTQDQKYQQISSDSNIINTSIYNTDKGDPNDNFKDHAGSFWEVRDGLEML